MTKPEPEKDTILLLGTLSCAAALVAGAIIGWTSGVFAALAIWLSLSTGSAAVWLWMRRVG